MGAILRVGCLCVWASMASALPSVLWLGDSLSTGYGVNEAKSWPTMMRARLARHKPRYQWINLSEPGLTTSLALMRWKRALKQYQPQVMALALGANDALRGVPMAITEARLAQMLDAAKPYGPVVFIGGGAHAPKLWANLRQRLASHVCTFRSASRGTVDAGLAQIGWRGLDAHAARWFASE